LAELWFYHHERARIENTLPELLQKLLGRGGRALVVSPDETRLDMLDQHLWSFRDDSFLPHGRADGPEPARQPVLLSPEPVNLNAATMLFCLDGADPGPIDGWERVIVMFEASDETALARARALWSARKKSQTVISYWRQGPSGGWERQT